MVARRGGSRSDRQGDARPSIVYAGTWAGELGDDEAIVVTGTPPASPYWSFQLQNRWMESLDWRQHQVFFSAHETVLQTDGRFRIVIAHRDPGEPNWLSTTGLRNVLSAMRAVGGDPDEAIDVSFERIDLRR